MRYYSSPLGFVGAALLLLSVDHCSSSSSDKPSTPSSSVIGTAGGTVESTDGVISVKIPAGAVSGDVTVTVTPESAPPAGAVGAVYDIGPSGTVFNSPVTMTFHYALASLGGAAPSSLRAATYGSNTWQILAGGSVDTNAQTVSGTTMHLSTYGEILESSGQVCVQVGEGGCTATSGGGAPTGSGGSPGTGGGTVTSGAPTSCTEPTCATATNLCAGYPGSTMTGCTEGASGVTASCCFAPAAPICFAVAGNAGCVSSGTSTGGTQAQPVCPQATCAGAVSPCGGYPGATFGGCTDSANGWAGSCCFAPDTPVCVLDNTSVGCVSGGAPTGTSGPGVTGGGGGNPGSSGGGCPAPPTCATSTACGDIVGSTAQSCSDTASGYTATCCLPAGVLPSAFTGGGGSGGTGGSIGGGSTSGPPAGSDAGGSTSYPPDGSTNQPPPPFDAGEQPMLDVDAGKPPPMDQDAGKPPPDQDSGKPTSQPDSGFPGQPDSGLPSQPDASACQYKVMPLGGGMCGVQGTCPATGTMYRLACTPVDAGPSSCTCTQNGSTTGTATVDCATIAESDITMCGYPD
jgi:hypothetical protein